MGGLQAAGVRCAPIHGDMDQHSRMEVLGAFKAGRWVWVCPALAAQQRGGVLSVGAQLAGMRSTHGQLSRVAGCWGPFTASRWARVAGWRVPRSNHAASQPRGGVGGDLGGSGGCWAH